MRPCLRIYAVFPLQKTFQEKIIAACARRVFARFGELEVTGFCAKQVVVKDYCGSVLTSWLECKIMTVRILFKT